MTKKKSFKNPKQSRFGKKKVAFGLIAVVLMVATITGAVLLTFYGKIDNEVDIESMFEYSDATHNQVSLEELVVNLTEDFYPGLEYEMNFCINKTCAGDIQLNFDITDDEANGVDVYVTLYGQSTPLTHQNYTGTENRQYTYHCDIDALTPEGTYPTTLTFN